VPTAAVIATLVNPNNPNSVAQLRDMRQAAAKIGVQLAFVTAKSGADFHTAFASVVQQQARALIVSADPSFNSRREQLVALAARYTIPAIYEWREFAAAGGLISYGSSIVDGYRQVGNYTGTLYLTREKCGLISCKSYPQKCNARAAEVRLSRRAHSPP
jgi:putative tryptophan/tyrosine transport system substrate-binding protein